MDRLTSCPPTHSDLTEGDKAAMASDNSDCFPQESHAASKMLPFAYRKVSVSPPFPSHPMSRALRCFQSSLRSGRLVPALPGSTLPSSSSPGFPNHSPSPQQLLVHCPAAITSQSRHSIKRHPAGRGRCGAPETLLFVCLICVWVRFGGESARNISLRVTLELINGKP